MPPQEPHPPLSAFRAPPHLPHSKISSDAVVPPFTATILRYFGNGYEFAFKLPYAKLSEFGLIFIQY